MSASGSDSAGLLWVMTTKTADARVDGTAEWASAGHGNIAEYGSAIRQLPLPLAGWNSLAKTPRYRPGWVTGVAWSAFFPATTTSSPSKLAVPFSSWAPVVPAGAVSEYFRFLTAESKKGPHRTVLAA